MILVGALGTWYIYDNNLTKELYILFVGLVFAGLLFVVASLLRKKEVKNGFTIIITDMLNMPDTMKQLAWVQFFSWCAFFDVDLYHSCRDRACFRNIRHNFGSL